MRADPTAEPTPPPRAGRGLERALVVALCGLVAWFDLWTVRSSGDPWKFGREQRDYYNLLIDGWLDGQLHMKVDVPPALLALPDPYDPNGRPAGLVLHDASFYRGKYYLYFGAAPVVTLMLPFRLITGVDLPLAVAVLVFVYGGFLASVATWLAIRRRYFPGARAAVVALVVAALGVASLGPVLLRRPHMWELPIAAGSCFALLALAALWESLHSPRRRAWWLAGAALALGLAVASRPTYLVAMPLLAAPLVAWARPQRRWPWRETVAALVPLAVVGGAMAWHNWARFGNPLQFGQAYQFSLDYESKVTHFSPRFAPLNAWRYFLSAAQWSRYFPFIQPADWLAKPAGFAGGDDVYGVLRNLPFALLALFAPLAWWRRAADERALLGAWLAGAGVLFAAVAAVLLCFFGSLARYQFDFTPALMLIAAVGVLAVERWLDERGAWLRWPARAAWRAAAAMSVGFGVLFSLEVDGLLGERNPRKAREVAAALNRVPAFFERALGVRHGAIEFDVTLAPRPSGPQVLATIGDPPRVTRVEVHYLDGERVQLGLAPSGAPAMLSRPLELDFARRHVVRVELGSLLPPPTHPFFAGRSAGAVADLTRRARLDLDGETLIDERRRFDGATGRVRVGRLALADPATRFDREIGPVRHVDSAGAPDLSGREAGFARVRFTLPERPATPREPFIAFGTETDHGLVFLHYVGENGRIAFGSVVHGDRRDGAAIEVDARRGHELTARWEPAGDPALRRLQLRLDGAIVFSREVDWPQRDAGLVIGRNVYGEAGAAPLFTGALRQVQRSADGRDPLAGPGDTLRLRVQLPRAPQPGSRDPLVVTGQTGGGDMLMIEYVDAKTVRFALDHWGSPLIASAPVPLDLAQPHDLDLTLSSLAAPADVSRERAVRPGRVQIAVDGTVVWQERAYLFTAEASEVFLARNPIGGTGCGERFSGEVLTAERIVP